VMSNPKSWHLTYTSTLPPRSNQFTVIAAMEDVVSKKEAKKFSKKCQSQLWANELFPPKNDCRKFQEQCKLNFFFPDVDKHRLAEITQQRRLERKKMMLRKAASSTD